MALIDRVREDGATLVINGDALDVQQAWSITRVLRAHQPLLASMSRLAQDGRLIYVLGNHDQDVSVYAELLHFRVCDAVHVGDQILISHGHEHDPYIGQDLHGSDFATRVHHLVERVLDTWLRLPLSEFYTVPNRLMFWLIHHYALTLRGLNKLGKGVLRRPLGQGFMKQLDYWARSNMGDPMCMMHPVLHRLQQGPWSWLACGHSHFPGLVRVREGGYVNTGSWTFASSQYAVWDGVDFVVKDWISGRNYQDELYRPVLSGALDEKDYWQWWRENYMGWLRFREGEERKTMLPGWASRMTDEQAMAQLGAYLPSNVEKEVSTTEKEPTTKRANNAESR